MAALLTASRLHQPKEGTTTGTIPRRESAGGSRMKILEPRGFLDYDFPPPAPILAALAAFARKLLESLPRPTSSLLARSRIFDYALAPRAVVSFFDAPVCFCSNPGRIRLFQANRMYLTTSCFGRCGLNNPLRCFDAYDTAKRKPRRFQECAPFRFGALDAAGLSQHG